MTTWLQLVVLLLSVWQACAWLNGGDYTKEFEKCTGVVSNELSQGMYEQQCTDLLIPLDKSHQRIGNFTDSQMNYITGLFRKMFTEMQAGGNRVRRHANTWRYRQEIRSYNGAPFARYAKAVVAAKQKGIYDILAKIHVTVISNAHLGPNFLPWHRLYLIIVETALGVPVPYWDSTEDYIMKDPSCSVVWTDKYFGDGVGPVNCGPFAKFSTPLGAPLFRKVNSWGSLIDRPSIFKYVLSQKRLGQISTPTALPKSNLELYHNDVHAWVGGVMANIPFSAYDPVFFTLHSFIDLIWEMFRQSQLAIGIDPAKDFVKTKIPGQDPRDKAQLDGFLNIDGYSGKIASKVIYEPLSECPVCDKSVDKYCGPMGQCVSVAVPIFGGVERLAAADYIAKTSGVSAGKWGGAFVVGRVDKRVRGDPVQKS